MGAPKFHYVSPNFIFKEWRKIVFIQTPFVDDTFAIRSHYFGETFQKLNDIDENI